MSKLGDGIYNQVIEQKPVYYNKITLEVFNKMFEEIQEKMTSKEKAWDQQYERLSPKLKEAIGKEIIKNNKDMQASKESIGEVEEMDDKTKELLTTALETNDLNSTPLEKFESVEERRINILKSKGVNPYSTHPLTHFDGVAKHKSVWRAMRRGHVSVNGEKFPNRPFTNSKSKGVNEFKKQIYGEYKKVSARV